MHSGKYYEYDFSYSENIFHYIKLYRIIIALVNTDFSKNRHFLRKNHSKITKIMVRFMYSAPYRKEMP